MFTVSKPTVIEYEVKNSRFISELMSYDLFEGRLAELRGLHPKASHHVTAYRYLNDQRQLIEHGKDDGEVSGTAGVPALRVLQGHELTNVGLVIVRYFGGTKLGTGGLVRAYTEAASTAVKQANLIPFAHQIELTLNATFAQASELERHCAHKEVHILSRDFTEHGITVLIKGPEPVIEGIKESWGRYRP